MNKLCNSERLWATLIIYVAMDEDEGSPHMRIETFFLTHKAI